MAAPPGAGRRGGALSSAEGSDAWLTPLHDVETLRWVEAVSVDSLSELMVFNHYIRVLGSDDRNIGEASILAWAEISSGVAVVDDNAAVNAARARGVTVRRSLGVAR